MDRIDNVKKMQSHAAEVAAKLSDLIDAWMDFLIADRVLRPDERPRMQNMLESDANAMAAVLRVAGQLSLSNPTIQIFAIATFLKNELIIFNQYPPERWMKGRKR